MTDPEFLKLEARLIEIVRDFYALEEGEVVAETRFVADLGADSLDSMEILMAIEEEWDVNFGSHLSLEELKTIRTATEKLHTLIQESEAQE